MGIIRTSLVNQVPMATLRTSIIGTGAAAGGGAAVFTETGTDGNIALIGFNDLTVDSYDSSTEWDGSWSPEGAFDGYDNVPLKYNDDAYLGVQNSNSGWISSGGLDNQWIGVDLGVPANISGFAYLQYIPLHSSRAIKTLKFQVSSDGVIWTDHETFNLPEFGEIKTTMTLATPVITQYPRFYVEEKWGTYFYVVDIEIYQL